MGVPCRTEDEYWEIWEQEERLERRLRIAVGIGGILFLIAWRWL